MKNIKLIILSLFVTLLGCENKYKSPIPDVPVEIGLNMLSYDPTFGSVINDTLVFTYPRSFPPFRIGYGGVLIVVGLGDNFSTRYFSYDLACPYEVDPNVRVYPNEEGYAVCRKCGSEFYITDGWGRVSKGPSKFPLKRYQTDFVNNHLIVRN